MNRYVRMALVAAVPALLIGLTVAPPDRDPLASLGMVLTLWVAWSIAVAFLFYFIEMAKEP